MMIHATDSHTDSNSKTAVTQQNHQTILQLWPAMHQHGNNVPATLIHMTHHSWISTYYSLLRASDRNGMCMPSNYAFTWRWSRHGRIYKWGIPNVTMTVCLFVCVYQPLYTLRRDSHLKQLAIHWSSCQILAYQQNCTDQIK